MGSRFFQVKSYLSYWLDAVDKHSLHSPFFFDFYTQVVKGELPHDTQAEALRRKLLTDNRTITVEDFGSKAGSNKHRSIASIAATALTPPKFSALYRQIIRKYNSATVVELGTSLGINTLYLRNDSNTVTTFEGSRSVADIAELTFEFAQVKNIHLVHGNIDTTLRLYLQGIRKIDFAMMDANHTYEATVRYFNLLSSKVHAKTVIVLDDIHYSEGMEQAWKEIRNHPLVYGSADLYRCGLLFFDPSLNKQHVILQF